MPTTCFTSLASLTPIIAATVAAPSLTLVIIIIVIALVFDFLNGFHDAANSIATVVSTRVLSPTQAVIWAAAFNFLAVFFFGTKVSETISGKLMDTGQLSGDVYVVFAGLCGAIVWNIITWWLALPTSSSHALISGYAGAAIAKVGFGVIKPAGWEPVLLWIVLSPLIGFSLGAINMIVVSWMFRRSTPHKVDSLFRRLQLFSAGAYSLGHGGNDAQKTMGIIVALLVAAGRGNYAASHHQILWHKHEIALWIIFACQAAIALGTMSGGCAHRQNNGLGHHAAAAGRWLFAPGNRPPPAPFSWPPSRAFPSRPRTRSPARSSAWERQKACDPSAGYGASASSSHGCSPSPARHSSRRWSIS